MIQAIAIITDWSGIAPEYAYGTERPVIYLDIPQKVVNEQFAELELEPNEVSALSPALRSLWPHSRKKLGLPLA